MIVSISALKNPLFELSFFDTTVLAYTSCDALNCCVGNLIAVISDFVNLIRVNNVNNLCFFPFVVMIVSIPALKNPLFELSCLICSADSLVSFGL